MTNPIEIPIKKPYDKQQYIISVPKKKKLLILSRRWGKTSLAEQLVLRRAITNKNYRCAWSAPTYKSVIESFNEHIDILEPITARLNRDEKTIKLINGSKIEYWSSDNPKAGRGRKYHIWVSDETQDQRNLKEFLVGSVYPTLTDFGGELWVLGTANGEGSELHEFYLECTNDPELWYVATGVIEDNPFLKPEFVSELRRAYAGNKDLELQELDSVWVRIDGVAPLIRKNPWDALYDTKDDSMQSRVLALDSAVNGDTTSIVGIWQDPLTEHYYTDYNDIHCFVAEDQQEIDFIELENTLWGLWSTGKYAWLAYDPYQNVSMMQRLRLRGVRTFEFTQNNMRLAADSYLRETLGEGKYHHPNHEQLTEHILAATMKYTNEKIRLIKATQKSKIDLAVCLSMALWTHNLKRPGLITGYSPQVANTRTSTGPIATDKGPTFDLAKLSPWGK